MKKAVIVTIALLFSMVGFAQDTPEITYKKQGDLVVMTSYYENGSIKEQGSYKDQKLHGEWSKFDRSGSKIIRAEYVNGKKTGTWLFSENEVLTEVTYTNNKIASVYEWNNKTKIALN